MVRKRSNALRRRGLAAPALAEDPGRHADWIELQAVRSSEHFFSWAAYRKMLETGGSIDAVGQRSAAGVADEQLTYEALIDDVASELDYRREYCGGQEGGYPFALDAEGLQMRAVGSVTTYSFLLLLSLLGDLGPRRTGRRGSKLFEEVSAEALRNYLGGERPGVNVEVFGFPRRLLPSSFRGALDEVCRRIGEGEGARDSPARKDQKDAALDVIGWRGFRDGKSSKLIMFGHCASGRYWTDKRTELNPAGWCKLWMNRMPDLDPIGAFFVPHVVGESQWRSATVLGGVLFDRCRITWLVPMLTGTLASECESWSQAALSMPGISDAGM